MDTDIRKPVSHHFGIEHPGQSSASTSANLDDDYSDDEDNDGVNLIEGLHPASAAGGQDDDNENMLRLRAARDAMEQHDLNQRQETMNGAANGAPNGLDVEERINAEPDFADDNYPLYDSEDEDELDKAAALSTAKRNGPWAYRRELVSQHLSIASDKLKLLLQHSLPFPKPSVVPATGDNATSVQTGHMTRKRFVAPAGKRIHVPVRVEPKVYFAAERTFLAWLEFSIIIGSIAATLLNFGDVLSLAAAWAFTVLACLALLYSMVLYLWRVDKIRNRRAVTYHDAYGPTALCLGLLVAVVVAFGYRFAKGGEGGLRG